MGVGCYSRDLDSATASPYSRLPNKLRGLAWVPEDCWQTRGGLGLSLAQRRNVRKTRCYNRLREAC